MPVRGADQVEGAYDVEEPGEGNARPARQRGIGNHGEECGCNVAKCSGRAKCDGKSGDTTPGITNARPANLKKCKIRSGRTASPRDRSRSTGQM